MEKMRATTRERFINYSDEALQRVIDQSVGKPVTDGFGGERIGTIITAKRIDNSDVIEFEMELEAI